ncbi:MAG TPA: hypothetical protein VIZ30_00645 [Pseudomonadales bacterium]
MAEREIAQSRRTPQDRLDETRASPVMAGLSKIEVASVDYGSEEAAMVRYRADGERRAMALGNRVRPGSTRTASSIRRSCWRIPVAACTFSKAC